MSKIESAGKFTATVAVGVGVGVGTYAVTRKMNAPYPLVWASIAGITAYTVSAIFIN